VIPSFSGGTLISLISRQFDLCGRILAIVLGASTQMLAFVLIVLAIPNKANLEPTDETSIIEPR
jgi:ABC-type Na+ efflux pump permease subunit